MGNSCSTGCLLKDEERMEMKIDVGMGSGDLPSETTLEVGDVVIAIPGTKGFVNTDKVEVYKEGDEGIVRKFFKQENSGQERVKIAWTRTGLTTTCQANKWTARFTLVRKGVKKSEKASTPKAAKQKDSLDAEKACALKDDIASAPLDDEKENVESPSNRKIPASDALDLKLHADKENFALAKAGPTPLDSKDEIEKALMKFEAAVSDDNAAPAPVEFGGRALMSDVAENEAILDERAPELSKPQPEISVTQQDERIPECSKPQLEVSATHQDNQEVNLQPSDQGSTHAETGSDTMSDDTVPVAKIAETPQSNLERPIHLGDFRLAPPAFWKVLHANFPPAIFDEATMEQTADESAKASDVVTDTIVKPSPEELQMLADFVKASSADFIDFAKAAKTDSEFVLPEVEVQAEKISETAEHATKSAPAEAQQSREMLLAESVDLADIGKPDAEPAEVVQMKEVSGQECIETAECEFSASDSVVVSKDWRFLPSVGTWLMSPKP